MAHVLAERFVFKVRGDCQASIVEANDGSFYILKLANKGNPNLFFNEAFGSQLIGYFHLPMATWMPVLLTDAFIDSNPALWPVGGKYGGRPAAGLHFGSKLVTTKCGIGTYQLIPSTWLSRVTNSEDFIRVLAIDIWSNHCDRRQAIFTSVGQKLHATFIDNGHMFGGPQGTDLSCPRRTMIHDLQLYRDRSMEKILEVWRKRISGVSERTLRSFLESIPGEWYTEYMAGKVIADLLSRRSKLQVLFREAAGVLRTGSSMIVDEFVNSLEPKA